jgi:glycosyltransferase involved in cell wall biosynthesis
MRDKTQSADSQSKGVEDFGRHPLVSIVVPTYNSSRTLERCLQSVGNQDYCPFELIVVDRHSIDSTRSIAEKFGATFLLKGPERSSQKNWGAKRGRGELLYFVDSDFILERRAVSKCVELCRCYDAVSTINYSLGQSVWGKSIELKERFLAHDPTIQTARFIKKSVFLQSGGFDESLVVGEDLDFYRRLQENGFRIGSASAIEWHIGEPETLRDVARRSFYYGKVVKAYLNKRKGLAVRQLSPLKPNLFLALIKTGSLYLPSLLVVDVTRWMSALLGLLCSERI